MKDVWAKRFPSPWMLVLLGIGFIDLVSTAVLYRMGLITELNPIMRPIIDESVYLFAFVKGATLFFAYMVLIRHWKTHSKFIELVCIAGSLVYVCLWTGWFVRGSM